MALSYPDAPTAIRLTLTDKAGFTSVKDFYVPTTVWDPASDLFTAIVTIRDTLVTQQNLVTNALVSSTFITIDQQESVSLPTPDCDIWDIANVVVNIAGGQGKRGVIKIPCPAIGIFQGTEGADRNNVDIADADLGTFVDQFQTTGGSFVISDGEFVDDTTPMVAGKRISRKSSRKA
jgi:hypothetical protein